MSFIRFWGWFGEERAQNLQFICSDMWKPYLKVIAYKAKKKVHLLDRFHTAKNMNIAIDKVQGTRCPRFKRTPVGPYPSPENLTEKQEAKLAKKLKTFRAYLLKEGFQGFWDYASPA